MNKNIIKKMYSLLIISILMSMVVAVFVTSPVAAAGLENSAQNGGPGGSGQNGKNGSGTGNSKTPLTDDEEVGLQKAILEEYKAYNLYQSVISQLGTVIPFEKIAQSEQQHISALTRQAEKYGVPVPANPGLANTPVFSDLASACAAGVAAEIEDAALYDTLKTVTDHSDILQVYNNLQNASLQNHLVEFQSCN